MFRKNIFIFTHRFYDNRFLEIYNQFKLNERKSFEELKYEQEKQLNVLIKYIYKNIPYYSDFMKQKGIIPSDILSINDLKLFPIIAKNIINKNLNDFKSIILNSLSYTEGHTGGTTGTPMNCLISKEQRLRAGCLAYRGWGYAGYELGDSVAFLAGSSLSMGGKTKLIKKINGFLRNTTFLSSFDMSEENLINYHKAINNFRPKFLRGYPSALFEFANWIEKKKLEIHSPIAIFVTSEKCYTIMREKIQNIFQTKVFDQYGLADGGITSYECEKHEGLHIDLENSILEIVDENGNTLEEGEGRVIATSLFNYAMPFIRYETGDIATITKQKCSCSRPYPLLKEIVGRTVDVLLTPERKKIHGWFFLYIFWYHCKGIKQYQVVQKDYQNIIIKIVRTDGFDEKQLDTIRNITKERCHEWKLHFEFVDNIETTKAGKFKFIINEIKD